MRQMAKNKTFERKIKYIDFFNFRFLYFMTVISKYKYNKLFEIMQLSENYLYCIGILDKYNPYG